MMRVGFAGTPGFAVAALEAIVAAGFEVPVVLTQPDRPKGRGLAVAHSDVKAAASRLGLAVVQPATLKPAEVQAHLLATPLDVLVVAAYGLILPPALLAWPRRGALNIHASLLPRWRGAAPIQRAILAGDQVSGVTIMQMDAGLDTGPMITRASVAIGARDTAGRLHDTLAKVGSGLIVETLDILARDGTLPSTPQPEEGVTHAAKIDRNEALINWAASARAIDLKVRAFDPAPGAYTLLRDATWKVWHAEPSEEPHDAMPGVVLGTAGEAIVVACGNGALRIHELQPAGGKRAPARVWLSGRRIAPGDVFGGSPI